MDNKPARNYQLDVLKLIFAFCVLFSHTGIFIGENTGITLPGVLGQLSVYFFFIVSGMLMVESFRKHSDGTVDEKRALTNVLKKFNGISYQYWTALGLAVVSYLFVAYKNHDDPIPKLIMMISEVFAIGEGGLAYNYAAITGALWYISAMLIVMVPLYYMLEKNSGFYIYVFSPLAGLLSMGYIYNIYTFSTRDFTGVVLTSLIKALTGLCMGSVAWIICDKLRVAVRKKAQRVVLTIAEVLLYGIYFAVWFNVKDNLSRYSIMLILPVAIGITFSSKSYICELFKFKWLDKIGSLSLAIYFNHGSAIRVVANYFPGKSYKLSLLLIFAFTAAFCALYYIIIALAKKLWNEKIHKALVE